MALKSKNFCIVLSSPSGAGKTSISKKIIKLDNKVKLSISCTTRAKRKGEIKSKNYFFINTKKFQKLLNSNEFLESAMVFGNFYGTLKKTVNNIFKKQKDVLFDIDWQGYQQLKQSNLDVIGIFILPPNKKELIRRLKKRDRDSSDEMNNRMNLVKNEVSHFLEYDYIVVNSDLDKAVQDILNIINSERLKRIRLDGLTSFVSKFTV